MVVGKTETMTAAVLQFTSGILIPITFVLFITSLCNPSPSLRSLIKGLIEVRSLCFQLTDGWGWRCRGAVSCHQRKRNATLGNTKVALISCELRTVFYIFQ